MQEFNSDPDLDWQAFAYWCDELPAADRERFEQLLAVDQQAREALARAVELSQTVLAAESLLPTPAARSHSRPMVGAWVAAIAASLLAMVVGFGFGQRSQWSGWSSGDSDSLVHGDPELAAAWSETRSEWDEVNTWQSLQRAESSTDGVELGFATDWDPMAIETPSWMTAAVQGQAAKEDEPDEGRPADDLPSAASNES